MVGDLFDDEGARLNDNLTSIRGYRPTGDRPRDRSLSYTYLQQDSRSAKLLAELRTAAVQEGSNCLGRPEQWTGDDLPTDRQAQLDCAGCNVFKKCEAYREAAHPAWGNWAGVVKGRKLKEVMEDGDE